MIVVTAGKEYIDIDAFASMVAYRDLLKLLGKDAVAVSTARMNGSIPRNAQKLASLDYDFLGATGFEGDQIVYFWELWGSCERLPVGRCTGVCGVSARG